MNKTDLRSLSLFFYDLIILVGLHSLVAFKTVTMIRLQIRPRRHRWAGPERRHLNTFPLRNQAHTDLSQCRGSDSQPAPSMRSGDMTSLGLRTNRLGIALLLIIIYLFYISIFGTQLQGKYKSTT